LEITDKKKKGFNVQNMQIIELEMFEKFSYRFPKGVVK
jgi:hypothetical protein